MTVPVENAPFPLPTSSGAGGSTPKSAFLKETVWRLDRLLLLCQPKVPAEEVMGPLRQLVDIVMKLRSPTGGWPADLPQTPENLLTYVGEEIWELLEALAQLQPEGDSPPLGEDSVLVPMEELIPHLLWLLASSNYEVMRLLEGVRSRIYTSDTQFSLGVVRLVPVLSLDFGETCYDLDLVTQAETDPSQFLPGDLTVKLDRKSVV